MAGSLVFGGEDWDVQEKVQDATLVPSVLDKAYAACILVTLPTVQHLHPDTEVMVQCTILSFVILDTEMRSALDKLKPGSVDLKIFIQLSLREFGRCAKHSMPRSRVDCRRIVIHGSTLGLL